MSRAICFIYFFTIVIAGDTSFDPEKYRVRELTAIRLLVPLEVDGYLTESFYTSAPIQTFIQLNPDNGELATEETDVWIGFDDAALYVGARLWDSRPDSIIGRLGRRDDDTNSDEFQVAIDAYHDKRSGFYFVVNPAGTIQDGTMANDSRFDGTWDGIWDWKTRVDGDGWTVEMRIPFSQLRFNTQDKEEEYIWGIGFGRMIRRHNEHSLTVYIPRGESGIVSHFSTLRGIRDITPPRRYEFTPYVMSGYQDIPSQKNNPFFEGTDRNMNVGGDVKLGLGNNLTIDATLNPDFGQVEVDPSVINLSAYETYYQEKRPFFVEGSNIFSFGSGGPTNRWGFNFSEPDFFYSRRIGRAPHKWVQSDGWVDSPSASSILGAAKISGKLNGDWSIGGLSAVTRREYARINEEGEIRKEEVEPLTSYNLIRSQKEFKEGRQGLGFLGTYVYRNFEDPSLRDVVADNSMALGVDGWTFFNEEKEWVISGWAGYTQVSGSTTHLLNVQQNSSHFFQRPDADHVELDSSLTKLSGYASRIIINKEKGHVTFNAALAALSPGYECNDLGLNFGTDRINKHVVVGYKWYDPGKVLRYSAINGAYMSNHNFSGTKINEMIFVFGYAQFLNYWSISGFTGVGPWTLSDTQLRGGPMVASPAGIFGSLNMNSDNRKNIVFGLGGNVNQVEGGNHGWGINGWTELKIGTQINLSFNPSYSIRNSVDQWVTQVDDDNATAMYGTRYIVADMDQTVLAADFRVDYTFTPTLSLQAYFQPFIAVGDYSRFKEYKKPESYDFMIYGEEGSTVREEGNGYILDPTGGEEDDSFYIGNPSFNYKALVGNAVLRWEFKPGSTLYLVWTRNGSDYQPTGRFRLGSDLRELFQATPDNVFALKVTYWIGR